MGGAIGSFCERHDGWPKESRENCAVGGTAQVRDVEILPTN